MTSLKDTAFYKEAFNELHFPFGTFYLFDFFVVAEIKEDILFNWEEHGKIVAEEILHLYDTQGGNVIYITHRIHPYSVKPADWIKFFRHGFQLKGYGIVSYTKEKYSNALLEKLFMPRIKRFTSLEDAIRWAQKSRNTEVYASQM